MTFQAVIEAVRQLTAEERDRLKLILDDLFVEEEAHNLTDAQKEELRRRLAEHRAHPDRAIPWEQVRARALARVKV